MLKVYFFETIYALDLKYTKCKITVSVSVCIVFIPSRNDIDKQENQQQSEYCLNIQLFISDQQDT